MFSLRRGVGPALVGLLLLIAPAFGAGIATMIAVQGSDHPGFGRLLFDVDATGGEKLSRSGDRVLVILGAGVPIASVANPPRNVLAVAGALGRVVITIAPGASIRWTRIGAQLALDVLDPSTSPGGADENPAAGPVLLAQDSPRHRAGPARTSPVPSLPVPPIPPPAPRVDTAPPIITPVVPKPITAPVALPAPSPPAPQIVASPNAEPPGPVSPAAPVAVTAAVGPFELTVQPLPGTPASGFLVPFEPGVGAAAFPRPGMALVLFDQRRPIDLAVLRAHPALAGATAQLLPAGTLLRLPLTAGQEVVMDRVAAGWTVAVRRASPRELQRAIGSQLAQGRLEFKAEDPANVIPLADPDTGATLLVGTLHRPGSAMAGRRETAEFALAPSWLGLVVEPLSDALSLRVTAGGFTLTGRAEGLAMEQAVDATTVTAGGLTRRFDFAAQQAEALQRRMREQVLAAAAAPSLGRAVKRRDLALTMIALGLAPEAQTVLRVAAADDPRETDNADNAGLSGIAAMLAGRPAEATGLDDPRLSGSDEIAFWRALRPAMAGQDDPTAPTALAAGVPLLLGYPAAMRNRLAPLVAETLLQSGQIDAAKRLLTAMEDHPALALARALLLRSAGEGDKALAALDALAAGPDRLQRVRAGRQAVEARLADAALTPPQAADALEKLIFAWRGDGRELATRLRIAELRAQSDAWRPALAMLRESETLFPDEAQGIVARQRALVAALLDGPSLQTLPALDLVALVDENAGLLPTSAEGDTVMARLADRLVALDLPRRAAPLLQKMTAAAPAGASKAGLGNRLAGLRLQEGDAPGALQALAESAAEGLPDALAEARAVTAARATARTGDVRAAVALLNNLQGEEAQRARAAIHEDAGQWPQASAALAVLLPGMLPADGPLDERQQRFLLRLATAATQAGDADLLARLRTEQGARLPSGPVGDLFRLLTADSVTAVTDLPRAARELALARAISTEAGTTQAGATVAGRR